jgi:hypothetical protein
MKQRLDYSIRFQPFVGTPEEKVLTYLRNHQLSSAPNLAMQAIRSYWLPLVMLEDNATEFSIKQQLGRDAIRELLLHIDYICSSLGLERFWNYTDSNSNFVQTITSSPIKSESNFNLSTYEDKPLITQLEIEVGNGEWGNLGSFKQ